MGVPRSLLFVIVLITFSSIFGEDLTDPYKWSCEVYCDDESKSEWLQDAQYGRERYTQANPNVGVDSEKRVCGFTRCPKKRGGEPVQFDLIDYMHRPKPDSENVVSAVNGLRNPVRVWTWGARRQINEQ